MIFMPLWARSAICLALYTEPPQPTTAQMSPLARSEGNFDESK